MTLENVTIQDLIDLSNLLYGDNDTYEDWLKAFDNEGKAHDSVDEQIRIELIDSIKNELKANNYDGPNDYYAMYWFAKGLNLPVPQKPKRYVDSDDYLFNNLHKFKHHDKLNDFNKRIHERFNGSRLKEARELHKKDSTFLKDLMNHQKDLSKFNQYDKMHRKRNDIINSLNTRERNEDFSINEHRFLKRNGLLNLIHDTNISTSKAQRSHEIHEHVQSDLEPSIALRHPKETQLTLHKL